METLNPKQCDSDTKPAPEQKDRKFFRFSVGGLSDASEIRGRCLRQDRGKFCNPKVDGYIMGTMKKTNCRYRVYGDIEKENGNYHLGGTSVKVPWLYNRDNEKENGCG